MPFPTEAERQATFLKRHLDRGTYGQFVKEVRRREYAETAGRENEEYKRENGLETPQEFYQSDAWRRVRYQALQKHGNSCQCCGSRAGPAVQVHVDHIKPRSKFPELQLELSNLQILCEDCNLGKGNSDETDWRP